MSLPRLSPTAARWLGEYSEAVWIGAIVLKTAVSVLGTQDKTRAEAAAAALRLRRLVPNVALVLLVMLGIFMAGWLWVQHTV